MEFCQPTMVVRLIGVRVQAAVHFRHGREEARTEDHGHRPQQENLPGEAQHEPVNLRGHGLREVKQRWDHCKRRLFYLYAAAATFG